jgi:hypothetical protein
MMVPAMGGVVHAKELKQKTLKAFDAYVEKAEKDMEGRLTVKGPFLWIGGDQAMREQVKRGGVVVSHFGEKGGHKIPDGLVHDWVGTVFIPGPHLDETLALLQDFDRHKDIYPEVIDSKLLERKGNMTRGYLQFRKKKVITAVLNTIYETRYYAYGENRWYCRSFASRIAEVKDHGEPDARELPVGDDHGFLWRMHAYWRLEKADGGVYVECRSISLSRRVPRGLGWIVNPFIRKMPVQSLESTLVATRDTVMKDAAPPDPPI